MAGVPFEPLQQLGTPAVSAAAREVLTGSRHVEAALSQVDEFLKSDRDDLSKDVFRAWVKLSPTKIPADPKIEPFNTYRAAASKLAQAKEELAQRLESDVDPVRRALASAVQRFLPDYLVFTGTDIGERLLRQISAVTNLPPRNKDARARERTAVLYLQRICAKNDSLSAFGPCGWGRVSPELSGVKLNLDSGIAQRECFFERWTAHGLAAALNADPTTKLEIAPRIDPNGRIEHDRFVFAETGEFITLDKETLGILRRCDGRISARALGVNLRTLEELAEKKIIRWEVEVPALDPYAFETLVRDISEWSSATARERWLDQLQPVAELPAKFGRASGPAERTRIMHEAQARLDEIGAHHAASGRFLYAATNPIGEECLRETHFEISQELIDEVTNDAAPWIDLWRDCYAFIAGRVAAGLRPIFETAKTEAVALPAFLRMCENAKLPLRGPGLVALAHLAFQEVKAAFRELMAAHADKQEYELTSDDCHFIRRAFDYAKFDEYTYPSADMQLAAESIEAIARGDYQWILAELHPPVALLHHGFYWSCPDKAALSAALVSTVFGKPSFHFDFYAADFTATTTVRYIDALPDLMYFVAPQRGNPQWNRVPPAEAEVYVDRQTGDVCLRKIHGRQHLGSFARAWIIPLGFHPFLFGMAPHTPRLRCGKVIVQRRAWTIILDELGPGDFTGVSRDLTLAVERLRANRDLPRFVYIRPTEQALRRSGAEGRDKDTKPIYIDLESYLFIELFHRWLTKAGELEVTEMLPRPDQLFWRDADGHRTFELRTQIVPRK